MKRKTIQKGNETRTYILNGEGVLTRHITTTLQTLLLSYTDVTIRTDVSEETFEFFVNEAERNQTLLQEQFNTAPFAMDRTPFHPQRNVLPDIDFDIPSVDEIRREQAQQKLIEEIDQIDAKTRLSKILSNFDKHISSLVSDQTFCNRKKLLGEENDGEKR